MIQDCRTDYLDPSVHLLLRPTQREKSSVGEERFYACCDGEEKILSSITLLVIPEIAASQTRGKHEEILCRSAPEPDN